MATLDKTTVEDILQIVSDLREETLNTSASRVRAVSRAERDFARRRFWRVHLLRNQTTTGTGSADYTIGSSTYPMRSKGLTEVFVGGQLESDRYQVVDYQTYWLLYNQNNNHRIVYEWYDAANDEWKMHINPAPATAETIYYAYFWQPPLRTQTTQAVVCPNPKAIALLALGDIYDGEDEPQKAALARQEAEQLIEEMQGVENSPAVNQTYAMTAASRYGIGAY